MEDAQLRLEVLPRRIFHDSYPAGMSTITFWAWVSDPADQLGCERATATLWAGDELVGTTTFEAAQLDALRAAPPHYSDIGPGPWLRHQIAFPSSIRADRVRYELDVVRARATVHLVADRAVESYQQRVALAFPIAGPFTIVSGHAAEGDHRERSQAFAYDIVPLGPHYELLNGGSGSENADFAGWGRGVRAPAGGRVVHAQASILDNPAPGVPIELDAGPAGLWTALGNAVVIDHGDAEFSILGHLQSGSVRVETGQLVRAGDSLGQVGNSGHSSGPHLHYHLMDGPTVFQSDGLPAAFTGLETAVPRRGALDEAP